MHKFNVWLNNRLVDSVFYSVSEGETIAQAVERVRRSLVAHDGYSPEIKVTWPKGQRITEDVFELHGLYSRGWELLTTESTRKEIRQRRKEYTENEGGTCKIVVKRERV